jgi:predicted Zn-dependent protease
MSSTTDEPRTKTIAAFSPKPLHPLSPAQRIEPGPLPTGYQMRVDSLNQIGQQLASAATSRDVRFQFETIYNPRRAATYHTEAGHVLVTSSLLERVETRHQLAAALALEMAELIQESEIADESRSLTAAGIPQTASLNGKAPLASTPAENEIDQMAADLLNRAGFGSLNLAAVKRDLGGLTGSTAHATAKPASDAAEPRPIRLQPALAN